MSARSLPPAALLCGVLVSAAAMAVEPDDPSRGAVLWAGQCAICHAIGPEAGAPGAGPSLEGVLDRPVAAAEGWSGYSPGLLAAGAAGAVWDAERLREFLADPYGLHPDTTMGFGGLGSRRDLDDLMAWLVPASRGEIEAPAPFRVAPEVLALEGEADWGEFLAAECTTCHRRDGAADGIPSITGWPEDGFVTVLHAYREGVRRNETMQTVARRLGDEEIAALAAYFATLPRRSE